MLVVVDVGTADVGAAVFDIVVAVAVGEGVLVFTHYKASYLHDTSNWASSRHISSFRTGRFPLERGVPCTREEI